MKLLASCLVIFASISLLAAKPPTTNEQHVLKLAQNAEVVVVAEVIELKPSLFGYWSGVAASIEHVRYRLIETLKGNVTTNYIDAGHYVVYNSLTADKNDPRLLPDLFKPGNRLILVLSSALRNGCKSETPGPNTEAFCCPNEDYGAVLADPKLVGTLRRRFKTK